ncbi:MAG: hypothetical protein IIA02_14155 [Proteobacteria bacterium]|uniref:hypothetical protein n=1 Tax=Aquabacterium sp. TaxID=1872578 RepID=UPI0035C7124A|nr:hypothetical protein [Pseudomonadota bacterium]
MSRSPCQTARAGGGVRGGVRAWLMLCLGWVGLPVGALAADGLVFDCRPAQAAELPRAMASYLRELGIDRSLVVQTRSADGVLAFTLDTAASDTDTLTLARRARLQIREARVALPTSQGKVRHVKTVSRQEILLALMQHGRQTRFSGAACNIAALREHVALRQNIVAWVDELHWIWPNGGSATWNTALWDKGTPRRLDRLDAALLDAMSHQSRYAIGCYTAAKLGFAQGVLDFYQRVLKSPAQAALVRERLLHDADPLVGIEPAATWAFEADFDPATREHAGKLLSLRHGVPANNFVPGDWAYLLNTDPVSSQETGYEGSNAIYIGRGQFVDFYDDNRHSYTYEEKLDEVYQWRHGVFSRSRDAARAQPLTPADYNRLSATPEQGGLLLDIRLTPFLFGHEVLPPLPKPASAP